MTDWSTVAAWWGAGTGTLAILFEVYKYARSGPRLHLSVAVDVKVMEFKGTAGKDHMEVFHNDVSLRVVNRGDETTTLTNVVAVHYRSVLSKFLRRPSSPLARLTYTIVQDYLPFPLQGGHEWRTSIDQRELLKRFGETGHLMIGVLSADREQPALTRVAISHELARAERRAF